MTPSDRHVTLLQVLMYLIVGGICFCIDIGGFILIFQLSVVSIIIASAISFTAATLANYLLCCTFVFRRGRFSRPEEMFRLFVIAVVGLGLNSAVVWLLAERLGLPPTLAKILAVLPVFAWNYLGRRSIVFDGGLNPTMALIAERVRGRL
jgi:putative flippase GtrA